MGSLKTFLDTYEVECFVICRSPLVAQPARLTKLLHFGMTKTFFKTKIPDSFPLKSNNYQLSLDSPIEESSSSLVIYQVSFSRLPGP